MEASKRMMINTVVQYVRSIVYMLLMLFTTRFVLAALGHEGFGVYSVIGSTVFLLGFITNSLASSTQRFLSFSSGKDSKEQLRAIFANAMLLHAGIATVLVLLMMLLEPVFMQYLNIPEQLYDSAVFVYIMVLLMVLLSFLASPVRALFIARENIIYVSIVEIIDSLLKFIGALMLTIIPFDSLKMYAVLMMSVSLFNLFAYFIYGCMKFDECHVPRLSAMSKDYMKKLTNFAVWNVYAVGAGVVRTQGFAIILNKFLGPIVNAAYGISLQVQNATSFVVQSILNAMNPQLMRAEGEGNRERMLILSTKESKYSFAILALLLIPLIFEMRGVLHFWLGTAPEGAVMFCQYSLAALMLDQLTIGLTSANQAIGKIRNYTLLISTLRIAELPLAWLALHNGLNAESVMWVYIGIELLIGIIRIPFLKVTAGLSIFNYCKEVIVMSIPMLSVLALTACLMTMLPEHLYRFILTEATCVIIGMIVAFFTLLTRDERHWITNLINKRN